MVQSRASHRTTAVPHYLGSFRHGCLAFLKKVCLASAAPPSSGRPSPLKKILAAPSSRIKITTFLIPASPAVSLYRYPTLVPFPKSLSSSPLKPSLPRVFLFFLSSRRPPVNPPSPFVIPLKNSVFCTHRRQLASARRKIDKMTASKNQGTFLFTSESVGEGHPDKIA
jgi:hypothetical protein